MHRWFICYHGNIALSCNYINTRAMYLIKVRELADIIVVHLGYSHMYTSSTHIHAYACSSLGRIKSVEEYSRDRDLSLQALMKVGNNYFSLTLTPVYCMQLAPCIPPSLRLYAGEMYSCLRGYRTSYWLYTVEPLLIDSPN